MIAKIVILELFGSSILLTKKILMIRQNDIGDLLELNFSIAQSTPGTLEESLGTIFLVFRAYGISMKLLQKELGA